MTFGHSWQMAVARGGARRVVVLAHVDGDRVASESRLNGVESTGLSQMRLPMVRLPGWHRAAGRLAA